MWNTAGGWRVLTEEEIATEPLARFGGAVAAMFLAALFALLPLALLAMQSARDPQGTTWVLLMMLRQAFGGDMKSAYVASSMLQMLALLVWAALFVIVTLLRARCGPTLASIAFAAAALIGPLGQFAIIAGFTGGDLAAFLQAGVQLPHTVLNLVAAVSFWAYMHEGLRPNLYFRRRVRLTAD
jgi:hypothetical protein